MFVHIALFKWKKNTSKEIVEETFKQVRTLKTKVPGIVDIMCGSNFSKWNDEFTHAVVVILKDREALENYRAHPDHITIGNITNNLEEKSIAIDFES
jgi:heme-degrading monooxygenase HmoA